jgi:hypothetical protein
MFRPHDRDDLTQAHLDALARCAGSLPSPFACEGRVPGRVTLRFANGVAAPLGEDGQPTPEALLARCVPATFGDGTQTRHNPSVRDALQCNAATTPFVVEGFDPATSGVLDAVRVALAPDDPNPLRAELYGVNVYRTGGFFVPHRDTPRGDAMLGTLVVSASAAFAGGDLVLTHQGETRRFAWGRRRANSQSLPWAAFFGDVDHAISKVERGDRVTLTWILHRGEGAPRATGSPARGAAAMRRQLAACMAESRFAPSGATLGFACEHAYANTPGFMRDIPALDSRSVLRLKGRDQALAAAALELGLRVRLAPYVVETGCTLRWQLSRYLTHNEESLFRRDRLRTNHMEDMLPVTVNDDDDEVWWVVDPARSPTGSAHGQGRFLGDPEFSSTGYFGNEGCDGTFYLDAALLIDLPTPSARARLLRPRSDAPAAAKTAKTAKAAKAAKAAKPGAELIAAQLREMGHGPAKVRAMLADGSLERVGFGWYRFTKP